MSKTKSLPALFAVACLLVPITALAEGADQKVAQPVPQPIVQPRPQESAQERAAYEALINGEATKAPKEKYLLPKDHLASDSN